MKTELLNTAIKQGLYFGYLKRQSILDLCNGDIDVTYWLESELLRLKGNDKLGFELDF